MTRPDDANGRDAAFDDASVPVGGRLWRAVPASPFWAVSVGLAVLVAAWVVGVGGWVLAETRAGRPPASAGTVGLVGWLALAVGGVPVLALVWMAELKRRGHVRRSDRARGRVLPVGSNEARVRLLPVGWHVAWLAVVGATAAVLLAIASDGRWFGAGHDGGVSVLWAFAGLVAAAAWGALLGSTVKKVAFRHGGVPAARASAFWRWFGYRWRFDVWACAVGALAVAAGLLVARLMATRPSDDTSTASDLAEAHRAAVVLVVTGVVMLVGGMVASTQFRRAGRDLATSESVA